MKEKTASKKVSFVDVTAPANQKAENVSCPSILSGTEKREVSKLPPLTKVLYVSELYVILNTYLFWDLVTMGLFLLHVIIVILVCVCVCIYS